LVMAIAAWLSTYIVLYLVTMFFPIFLNPKFNSISSNRS
jgi:hypothetical protein